MANGDYGYFGKGETGVARGAVDGMDVVTV